MSQKTEDAIAEREKRTRTGSKAETLPRRSTAKKAAKEAK